MADYINKNILCQAYVHVEPDEINNRLLSQLEAHLTTFVKSRAEFFLYPNPDVEIELKDGSIKLYATVLGTVTTLFAGIANYPEFREGAIMIYDDVKLLSEYITAESLFSTKARHHQVIRTESRTGVIGSMRKIVSDYDQLNSTEGELSPEQQVKKLAEINDHVNKLILNLHSNDDVKLIKEGFLGLTKGLPDRPSPSPQKRNSPMIISHYQNELEALNQTLKR